MGPVSARRHDHVIEIVTVARCPVHGLHGRRARCFVCDEPVEQVAMIPVADTITLLGSARRLARELRDAAARLDEAATGLAEVVDPLSTGPLHGADIERGAVAVMHRHAPDRELHIRTIHRLMQAEGMTIAGADSGLGALTTALSRSDAVRRTRRGHFTLTAPGVGA
jgi:hypothetical protein